MDDINSLLKKTSYGRKFGDRDPGKLLRDRGYTLSKLAGWVLSDRWADAVAKGMIGIVGDDWGYNKHSGYSISSIHRFLTGRGELEHRVIEQEDDNWTNF